MGLGGGGLELEIRIQSYTITLYISLNVIKIHVNGSRTRGVSKYNTRSVWVIYQRLAKATDLGQAIRLV